MKASNQGSLTSPRFPVGAVTNEQLDAFRKANAEYADALRAQQKAKSDAWHAQEPQRKAAYAAKVVAEEIAKEKARQRADHPTKTLLADLFRPALAFSGALLILDGVLSVTLGLPMGAAFAFAMFGIGIPALFVWCDFRETGACKFKWRD